MKVVLLTSPLATPAVSPLSRPPPSPLLQGTDSTGTCSCVVDCTVAVVFLSY